jgi:predicted nucleotidyltransferase
MLIIVCFLATIANNFQLFQHLFGARKCSQQTAPLIDMEMKGFLNMMSKEDRKILKKFKVRIHERFSDARVWAFGSRARGEATWESDFDIFIVLSEVDQKIDRWIRDIAWEVGFENERVITTVLLDKAQFEHGPMSESTIVDNVLREGISA